MNQEQKSAKEEGMLKKALVNSGYSRKVTDKILKWYNPQEQNSDS
jgi:hypothetical protein